MPSWPGGRASGNAERMAKRARWSTAVAGVAIASLSFACSSSTNKGAGSTYSGPPCAPGEFRATGQANGAAVDVIATIDLYALQQLEQPSSVDFGLRPSGTVHFEWSGLQGEGSSFGATGKLEYGADGGVPSITFGAGTRVTLGPSSGTFHGVATNGAVDGCWLEKN